MEGTSSGNQIPYGQLTSTDAHAGPQQHNDGESAAQQPAPEYTQMPSDAPPPPSYYEAIHVQQPQIYNAYRPAEPRLTYIDFLPDGPNYKYPDLVNKANFWLAQNLQFRLQSCETVSMSLKQGIANIGSSLQHTPSGYHRDFTKILRCWIVKCDVPLERSQTIRTIAQLPAKRKSLTISFGSPYYRAVPLTQPPSFGRLTECLKSLNEHIAENPIQGKILRVETSSMIVSQMGSMHINLDPDILQWTDSNMQSVYCKYLRLFYLEGEPAQETIGFHDVIPGFESNRANPNQPKFENFTQTLYRAGHWAFMQQDKRITNVQTCFTKVAMDPLFPISARRPVMDTTESEWSVSRMSMGLLAEGPIAQFLRVFYVTSPAEPQLSKPYQLYARSFLPYKVSNRQYEVPADNIRRMGVWISFNQHYGLTEDNILCVESVDYPISNPGSRALPDAEKMSHNPRVLNGGYRLASVRVYTNGIFNEPPIEHMRIPIPVITPETSECCTIL